MSKRYSQEEMKRILRQDIGTSDITEQKIQEAYAYIRSTGNMPVQAGRTVFKKWMVIAAAVGLLGVSSVTALAVNGFFAHRAVQEEDSLTYTFDVNYELTPYVVEITPGYIPEGYEQFEEGNLKYDKEGYRQNGISLSVVTASFLDAENDYLNVQNVKSVEDATINGMEAQLITINYDPERVTRLFDKRIYLFNEEEGYVGIVFGGNDLTMEELTKVAEGLTFTVTDKESEYMSAEEKEAEKAFLLEQIEKEKAMWEYGVPQEYIYQIGDTFNYELDIAQAYRALFGDNVEEIMPYYADKKGVEFTVTGTEVLDSMADFPVDGFGWYEDVAERLNEDGTLKPYQRVTYEIGEIGVDEAQEISRDEVTQKFVKVTLQAKNLDDETVEFWAGETALASLNKVENGNYQYPSTYTEPLNTQEYYMGNDNSTSIYFDQSPYAGQESNHFFYRELEPGETLEYTLLFVVDEDRTDNMYLRFGNAHGDMNWEYQIFDQRYVDISQ
ncbi:MAG: hypothetical protein Q4F83_15895 [Eubacteriales bacterium]|nr:hypothetical protein [Eubacteriales bacterium]